MEFVCVNYSRSRTYEGRSRCYLINDNWDDFGFKTTFDVVLVDDQGEAHELGAIKIMTAGLRGGRVDVPETFPALSREFCSLGQDQNYYETLMLLPENFRREYLTAIRDCVFNVRIWNRFKSEDGMQTSLLRSVGESAVEFTFRSILAGEVARTPFHFTYEVSNPGGEGRDFVLDVDVEPASLPPTNIHAIIGRNGVGKTRLFAGITHTLMGIEDESGYPLGGDISFSQAWGGPSEKFANLVTVTFSAFDSFNPLSGRQIGDIKYNYVGLKNSSVRLKRE